MADNNSFAQYQSDFSLFNKITTDLDNYISDKKFEKIENDFFQDPQFEFLQHSFSSTVGVINFITQRYISISQTCENLFGYSVEDFKNAGLEFVINLLRKDHAKIFVNEIYPSLLAEFQKHALHNQAKNIKASYTNLLRLKDGTYKWFLHQLSVLKVNAEGYPVVVIKYMTDIEGIKKNNTVDFAISKKNENGIFEVIMEKTFLQNGNYPNVTAREKEILQLVSQGMSGKEIADNLFISEHTVYTHKKNMLKKFDLRSSSELIRFSMANGMLQ